MVRTASISVALLAAIWFIYGQTRSFDFVTYDDPDYVTENRSLALGLSSDGLSYALKTPVMGFYHPLTMLSLLADYELYGLDAAGYHLGNVFLHSVNTLLLFGFLQYATRRPWTSAVVAALFAVHPLRVESVAWIAERKDVLSTCFGFGCLWAYAVYARSGSRRAYWLSVALLAAGLLSKSMLVTVPLFLLLLDHWPFGRSSPAREGASMAQRWAGLRPLLLEKLPFIVLAAIAAAGTIWIQHQAGAMGRKAIEQGSLGLSFAALPNVVVGYARYVAMTLWPSELSVLYPHPRKPHAGGIPLESWQVAQALAFLMLVSALVWRARRPCLTVGWLWYLIGLLPVIGFIQIGSHALADRYTYLPSVGLLLIACFGVAEWVERLAPARPSVRPIVACSALVAIGALAVTARSATAVWRNSDSLYEHAIRINPRNTMMHYNFGNVLRSRGEIDLAMQHFRTVTEIDPGHVKAHINLGEALAAKEQHEQAVVEYLLALRVSPSEVIANNNLANSLKALGRDAEAEKHYQAALRSNDGNPLPHYNYGNLLLKQKRLGEAEVQYRRALALRPDYPGAMGNLGNVLLGLDRIEEAAAMYRRTLELDPDNPVATAGLRIASSRMQQEGLVVSDAPSGEAAP